MVDVLGGVPKDTHMGLSLSHATKKIANLPSWGSAIYLYIEAKDGVPWSDIQKLIDAANRNATIQIQSVKVGGFIKSHEEVMKELQPNK